MQQVLLAIASIVIAEVVRDIFHVAGHFWEPLKKHHMVHHRVYRRDLSVISMDTFKKAQWSHDIPEAFFMLAVCVPLAVVTPGLGMWVGCLYILAFLIPAFARAQGKMLYTDLTHEAGALTTPPGHWTVNRTYHWRHHFDDVDAYFCGYLTIVDKIMGKALSLKGKTIAITGASGTLGRALTRELTRAGAKVIALTSNPNSEFTDAVKVVPWQIGEEAALRDWFESIDILLLNHGVNDNGDRHFAAVQRAYEVNAFSCLRLAELFLETVNRSEHKALKELWVNTSEAEANPAFSPLYELSKRTLGDLITMRRLDAPCVIRKLILGPFKSSLNPVGIMSAQSVARGIVFLAKRDFRNIIVTINPLTFITIPLKEISQSLYFRLFTKATKRSSITTNSTNAGSTEPVTDSVTEREQTHSQV
ncbi:bifunctional sterol desaturase/short chain dehydrogenase [filamentous cyanobacterium LEGE 11480]|uniref:Bifunctional sterol desaturase/short chain dehydrogenase n=1 Tax=Romeriopsis navalis LEGE 11480 TaxID=2777977 RepID=A0A928VPA7_9CYAN|nr:bifunctional sterol desaturase/short chain dehydrogenase [Romeriopsis navalis LEGE 11480]